MHGFEKLIVKFQLMQDEEARLQELDRLRALTSELLREEDELRQLAGATPMVSRGENVLEPRNQILEYTFSRPVTANEQRLDLTPAPPGITSLTVSDMGQSNGNDHHRVRHHHGQPNWLLKRTARRAYS